MAVFVLLTAFMKSQKNSDQGMEIQKQHLYGDLMMRLRDGLIPVEKLR